MQIGGKRQQVKTLLWSWPREGSFFLIYIHGTPCHQTWSWTFDPQQCCYRADCHSSFGVEKAEARESDELLRGVVSDEAEAGALIFSLEGPGFRLPVLVSLPASPYVKSLWSWTAAFPSHL